MTGVVPPDGPARSRIRDDLDATLFVEAGAGSGKTSALVDRVLSLVATGTAELGSIAAITFTEKAAGELRDRIRQGLERRVDAEPDPAVVDRYRLAVDQLDSAAIGTLHAFAQRTLSENPIEAGLPPRVEILDEVSSGVEFDRRWTGFRDRLLVEPALERTLLLLFGAGVKHGALRVLALEFERNWDLVEERVPADGPEPPDLARHIAPALAAIDTALAAAEHCIDTSDKLYVRLRELEGYVAGLRNVTDELDLLDELNGKGSLRRPSSRLGNTGAKAKWGCDIQALKDDVVEAFERLDAVVGQVAEACAERIASALRPFTLDAARQRQASGQLAFHDLLVLSRALVRHPEHGGAVRQRLHDRYRCLLLDEFQDTDPIQIEVAVRIAAEHPSRPETAILPWDEVPVGPGRLFVVGDPKQSIYRFRRADISVFLDARKRFGDDGGLVELTTNFRTADPVVAWANHTFGALMAEAPEVEVEVRSQPSYVDLVAVRPPPPVGPPVSVLARARAEDGDAARMRAEEAAEVAAAVARAVDEGWSVDDGGTWRPARLGDITVLVPARTSLPFLEEALGDLSIPYRAESSSLVYVTRAVRDLLMALRSIDDPTDHLAVVTTLRSPLFGCGDDDLFRFKVTGRGHWNYLAPQPDTVDDGPVSAGLDYLRRLHRERHWSTPGELLDRVARDRRSFELGFAEGRTRDVWRRLRFVIDQARAWSEATSGGLRQYLQWVKLQADEGSRVAEAVLPETDDDAVRIMTIHAAKGLEFPITIVSGMSTVPQSRRAPAEVAFPPTGGVGYRFGSHITTDEYDRWRPIDEQMGYDERIRLLYVACTRARDHLVVSLQGKRRKKEPDKLRQRTNAELLIAGMGEMLDELPDAADAEPTPRAVPSPAPPGPPPPFDAWQAERTESLSRASRPTTVAATALAADGAPDPADHAAEGAAGAGAASAPGEPPDEDGAAGLQKRPRDLDLPPWLKGRYGTAVGRAVHGVLQTVDLATGRDLDAIAAAQCEAEAIPERLVDVVGLARAALGSDTVRAAAQGAHWREVYACVPTDGGRLLEGYIDLLYRSDAGLVVVDYKTAATDEPAELARRVAGYRLQGASYALTVEQTTGEPVSRVVFLFLTPSGVVEIDLDDTPAAIAEVRGLVDRGEERLVH